jgi:hypothetical protein
VLSNGLTRLCSIAIAAANIAIAATSAQPIHAACVHHTIRPSPSTAATSAIAPPNRAKVTKSSGSNALVRSAGGNRTRATAASDSSASPN